MEFLKIDGSFGEGGGQIVRTALTLSCITRRPIILEKIRQNRKNPGLKPQHLTAIKILQKICNAKVEGDEIGSTSFKFMPDNIRDINIRDINIREDVGTAGSISLILQVLIPISSICQKKVELFIKGGTDVLWSPTMDYTRYVLGEAYSRMGINVSMKLIKRGYYPKGGGEVKLEIFPSQIKSISLIKRNTKKIKLFCSFSKLPEQIIQEKCKKIELELIKNKFDVEFSIKKEDANDSGSSILIASIDNNSIIGVDSVYDKKINEFNLDLNKITKNQLGIDENLADMLVLPASLTNDMTIFTVPKISKHLETNLYVASKFTRCKYGIGKIPGGFEVRIEGVLDTSI